MSDEPATGVGHVPRMRKSLQTSTPWLTGLEPRTMVLSPGSVGQVSLRATTPAVLVMSRFCGARSGNCGRVGGVSTAVWPNCASVQLILVNNWNPLRAPFWPKRLLLFTAEAAVIHSARWVSVSARHFAATRLRLSRTLICAAVRRLAGMASVRLIWPNWPACETFRPRLPDCGMSSIFIRLLRSFRLLFSCCYGARGRQRQPDCTRQKWLPGRASVPVSSGSLSDVRQFGMRVEGPQRRDGRRERGEAKACWSIWRALSSGAPSGRSRRARRDRRDARNASTRSRKWQMADGKWQSASAESWGRGGTRPYRGKGVAWLVPRALVHAGEAGLEGIDAGDLPVQS